MKKLITLLSILCLSSALWAQGNATRSFTLPANEKGKAVKYNAFGMGVYPSEHLMIGGNHISYRKAGFGISWRMGIKNIQYMRAGLSSLDFDTVSQKGWLTGNTRTTYSYGANLNFVIPITKKIPFYVGAGVVREKVFAEIQPAYANPGETEWQIDPHRTQFKFNFSTGVFVPLFSNVVLNVAYDFLPQTIFVGVAISGPFNYEDIDMW